MPRSVRTLFAAAGVTTLLVVSACGGGSGTPKPSAAAQPYVDAMTASMVDDDDFPGDEKTAECLSARFVGVIGVDQLEANDISPAEFANDSLDFSDVGIELDEKQGNALYDSFGKCGFDVREMLMDEMSADDEVSPAMQACIEQVFTDDNLRKFMVTMMIDGEDAMEDNPELEELMGGLMGCAFMGMGDMDLDEDFTFDEDFDFEEDGGVPPAG